MSTKFSYSKSPQADKSSDVFLLWLTSVYQYPINFSLTIWSQENEKSPGVLKSLTNNIGYIGQQNCLDLHNRGNAMVISKAEVQKLTNNGLKSLNCQIIIH